jgi:hypothetical protein
MKNSPTNIDQFNWFYDEPDGLSLIHEARTKDGAYIKTDQVLIPWALVRAALARKDRRKAPRLTRKRARRSRPT